MSDKDAGEHDLLQLLVTLLSQSGGAGLNSLVRAFRQAGLADIVDSWISTGPNLPISTEQIQKGVEGKFIRQLAYKTGSSQEVTCARLATLLPQLVDRLTPEGALPSVAALQEGLNRVKGQS
jgi:uncharacterized protein YidB (DUF937 family)